MQVALQGFTKLSVIRAFSALVLALNLVFYVNPSQAQTGVNASAEMSAATDNTALKTLLDVLKDDSARSRLIEELEAATTKAEPISALDEPVVEVVSLGRRIALITQEVGQEAVATFSGVWSSLSSGQSGSRHRNVFRQTLQTL